MTGRPPKYKAEYAKQAAKLCALGAVNRDLSDFFGVAERTIERWAAEKEGFSRALRVGKAPADDKVEAALYHRAIGYSHPDTDIRVVNGDIVKTDIIKHYPPDTKAALAWLYNRKKDDWHPSPKDGQPDDSLDKVIEIIRAARPD